MYLTSGTMALAMDAPFMFLRDRDGVAIILSLGVKA